MKIKTLRYYVLCILPITGLFTSVAPSVYAAGNNSLSVSPSSGTYKPGDTFTVTVNGYASDGSNAGESRVNGTMTFPANLLQTTGTSTAGNPYSMNVYASPNNSNGTVAFNGENYYGGPRNQTIRVMTVTFRVIGNGTANVGFTAGSGFSSPFSTKATNLSGGSYTLRTPAPPTCPSGQVGTPPNCSTPPVNPPGPGTPNPGTPSNPGTGTPSPTPTPTPTPTAPVVSEITDALVDTNPESIPVQTAAGELLIDKVAIKTGWKANTITWAVSLPDVTPSLSIGKTKDDLKPVTDISPQQDGSYSASIPSLDPGVRYYYSISAVLNADQEKKATYSGAFTTKGYPVQLAFTRNSEPLVGAKMTIEKGTYTTDKNGLVELELAGKSYEATVAASDGVNQKIAFAVAKKTLSQGKAAPDVQKFSFAIGTTVSGTGTSSLPIGMIIGTILGVLALMGVIVGFLLYRRRRADEYATPVVEADSYTWSTPSQVAVGQEQSDIPPAPDPLTAIESEQFSATELYDADPQYIPEEQSVVEDTPQNIIVDDTTSYIPEQPYVADQFDTEQINPITEDSTVSPEPPLELSSSVADDQPQQMSEQLTPPNESNIPEDQPSDEPGAVFHPDTGELDIIHPSDRPAHPTSGAPGS